MSTAQQLGLIGNSIKVQSLPTASAETFGAGNRFYTLIGQQEGYITGHTYHTVVANDVYSWEDVACGNYNNLDNIPVINQDLTASGFTPVANTYYRHTGATTDTFTQGVIYLYDTAYHKLGESGGGGGTTLNRYTFTVNTKPSVAQATKILQVLNNAIRIVDINIRNSDGTRSYMMGEINTVKFNGYSINAYSNVFIVYNALIRDDSGPSGITVYKTEFKNSTFSTSGINLQAVSITYLNDTEIT